MLLDDCMMPASLSLQDRPFQEGSSGCRARTITPSQPRMPLTFVFLLAACCLIIGRPFKLSGTRARTLEPGAPAETLHVDVAPRTDGWSIVGFIMMVDAFDAQNGATRFVPGSHSQPRHEEEALACGPAGSLIIFEARASVDHAARMRPEVSARIGDLAKDLLAVR
jgi:hypothetical protein